MLEHKADIDAQNDDKDTPMHLALRASKIEIVNLLLRHGGNPHIKGFHNKDCIESARDLGFVDLANSLENFGNQEQANSNMHEQEHKQTESHH